MELLATLEDPAVVRKILTHLGLPTDPPEPSPPRALPEELRAFDFPD